MNRSTGQPTVLVVDNDAGSLVALRALLEALGCEVVTAFSGIEAVERTRTEDFAAIIMDVRMPRLDGYAAASFIRQHPRSTSTPILFVSGEDLDIAALTHRYGHTGHVDSLRKPIDSSVLRSKIGAWLDLYRSNQQVHELERAADVAQTDAHSKEDLLAMVAHDLRGPLGALKASVDGVRRQVEAGVEEGKLWALVRKHFDLADRTIERMVRMVGDLLDGARLETTGMTLELQPHSFDEIIAQAAELLSPVAEAKGLRLETHLRGPIGVAFCDRDRMLQVLSNLVGNAIKFTSTGGSVRIDAVSSADAIEVCVHDTGPGIAPEQLLHVFEKYWQADAASRPGGLGLGLTIVRGIVAAHGGRVWATSQVGEGSQFFFEIPRASSEEATNARTG
jgi:signal transduction histidine kinase